MNCRNRRTLRSSAGRSGIALAETVGTIALIGTMLSVSAVVIHHAFAAHHDALEHFQSVQQMRLMEDRFRDDVHGAVKISIGETLAFTKAKDVQVQYSYSQSGLVRETFRGELVIGRQLCRVPQAVGVNWHVDRRQHIPLVVVRVEYRPDSNRDPWTWIAAGEKLPMDEPSNASGDKP